MTTDALKHEHHDHHAAVHSKVAFGFWIYIMTDFIMFATMLVVYTVLHNNTYGGPGVAQIGSVPHAFMWSLMMVTAAFICSLSAVAKAKDSLFGTRLALLVTFILGIVFFEIQYRELANLVAQGITWQGSAFLSSYFTLIGMFSVHIAVGLLWILILLIQLGMQGLSDRMKTRITCVTLFWQFLSLVWILIFTLVYLTGAI